MTNTRRMLLLGTLCALAAPVLAQDTSPNAAPRILWIIQEVVKPGKAAAHEQHESGWPLAYANAKLKNHYVALTSTTGVADAWYISGYGSYEQWEKENEVTAKVPGLDAQTNKLADKDADFINNWRSLVAVFMDSLSIGTPPDWGKVHGYRITTVRVKIGHTADFEKLRALSKAAYDKAGIDPHIGVYSVSQGVNTPTYLIFRPYRAMSEFDGYADIGRRMTAQITPEQREQMTKLEESAILTREMNTYAIAPRQSYPSAELAAGDPEFWKTSPGVAMQAKQAAATQAGKPKSPAQKQP